MRKSTAARAIAMVVLAVASGTSWAGWTVVARGPGGSVYYDRATLVEKGDLRRIWQLLDYTSKSSSGAMSQAIETEYDFARKKMRMLSVISYPEPMAHGKGEKLSRSDDPWADIAPRTTGATVLPSVCVHLPPTSSAKWEKIGETNEAAFFVDANSLTSSQTLRRIWELYDRKAKRPDASMRLLSEYDCKEARVRMLMAVVHTEPMAAGEILEMQPEPGDWAAVNAGTVKMAVMKYACSK